MAGLAKTMVFVGEDALTSVIRFPLWWYTRGLIDTASALARSMRTQANRLAIGVWIRNIFTPMYGQSDWQSRVMSVLVRTAQILSRGLFLCILAVVYLLGLALYVAAPFVAVAGMLFHFFGSFF